MVYIVSNMFLPQVHEDYLGLPESVVLLYMEKCPHCQLKRPQINTTEPAVIVAEAFMAHFEVSK